MPYDFTLRTVIPASAQEIYEAWLDSVAHSEMTGGKARMSDKIGAEVSAWEGYITGRNIELMPHQRIVQSWRTTEFTDDYSDSIITVMLEDDDGGTQLTLIHSNVPDNQTSYELGGWQEHYFEPMVEYFSKRRDMGKSAKAARIPKRKRGPTKAQSKMKLKAKSKRPVPKMKRKQAKRSPTKSPSIRGRR